MKIGCHTLTWANFYGDYPIDKALKEIKETGFEGVEIVEPLSKLGSPEELKAKLSNTGLGLASLSCGLNMDPDSKEDIEETKRKIDFANEFKVKYMMVCGGWLGEKRDKNEEDFKLLAEKLEACSEYAGRFGMAMAYHPHLDTIVETMADTRRLLQYLDKTILCLDVAHFKASGSDPIDGIRRLKERIKYVHLKDWDPSKKRFVELGKGSVNLRKALDTLHEIDYNGWIVVELDNTELDPSQSAKISRDFLRKVGV